MASPLRVRAQAVLTVIAGCVPVATGPPAPAPPPPEAEPPPLTAPESEVPEPEPELAAPLVGVMLPMSGSPFMREYSELIEEGMRAPGA
ncbi:MAG: hypothetical protein F4X47_04915 [Gammaproteobacteria bacterium]|nr:hypothetical protein [Gammaproteobacteria bacterium]